ncbi:FHA domain-containing protein [Nocardioides sp. zg-536]|uniref:FHA domain-containing protein n=1 Tax=Nocardioides faecalis TaxID=2803858 RepID=A0A938Y7G9_9ACTN|nr:FHA domain-containing protein [Nocardioides faecalis]MBM9461508.1 FHA domain-containing protein [Nocardioides faecalis]QVI57862.1 FHA domain-containing protein [Nocardioides faecalis]
MEQPVAAQVAGSAQDWSAASVVPGPGAGTLARSGPVVLLVGSQDADVVRPYLEQAAMVAANGGHGRQLVRGYALMLSTSLEDSPGFAALAPHATGLAVFVDGNVSVTVDGETVTGADSLAWVERLIPWPVHSVVVTLLGTDAPGEASPYRLDGGVVPAGSFRIGTGARPPAEPPAASPVGPPAGAPVGPPVAAPAPPRPGRPVPPVPRDERVGFQSVLLSDLDDDLDDFEPLPIVEDDAQVVAQAPQARVRGVYCKNRHFNDPRVLFCGICGINMVQQTPVLVDGVRPPLGVVVLDDGAVFGLDHPYLLGRDPDVDPRVASGEFRPLPIIDQSQQVSRVHARLELRGWDVVLVDNRSTNGTFVHVPRTPDWARLPPGGEHVLGQGTRVRIGHRTLAFNTHAGRSGP